MQKTRIAVLALLPIAIACGSAREEPRHASAHRVVYEIPRPRATEVATGDLRALMLDLDRVHFALDSAVVPDEARGALHSVARRLRGRPDLTLYVLGFADELGSDAYNWRLGLERAHAVTSILAAEGVPLNRIAVISFGEQRPIVDTNEGAHAANRRVEFRVMRGDRQVTLGREAVSRAPRT